MARIHDSEDERRCAVHRMLDHYLHTARTADIQLGARIPDRGGLARTGVAPEQPIANHEALDWFDAERLVLLALIDQAAGAGFDAYAWRLGDRNGQAGTLDSIGYAHHHLGHHDRAVEHYREAIALFRDLGSRYFEANSLEHLGDTNPPCSPHWWNCAFRMSQ